jgi:glycyl-tRNA synthetase (class II)
VGGFNDPMVDCRASKARYRADHLVVLGAVDAGAHQHGWNSGITADNRCPCNRQQVPDDKF